MSEVKVSQKLVRELESHVNYWCLMSTGSVFATLSRWYGFRVVDQGPVTSWRKSVVTGGELRDRYAFRPGKSVNSPIIVCHADTVIGSDAYAFDRKSGVVTCAELDDRLGIACMSWAIDCQSPLADCAMLVCDNEEIGQSTADSFSLDYSHKLEPTMLIEFDRRGTDAVTYDYGNDTWHALLQHCGLRVGTGSFSDICKMTDFGVSGVNIGVGYHREHSLQCHADLRDTVRQFWRAETLVRTFGHVTMTYEPPRYSGKRYYSSSISRYSVKPTSSGSTRVIGYKSVSNTGGSISNNTGNSISNSTGQTKPSSAYDWEQRLADDAALYDTLAPLDLDDDEQAAALQKWLRDNSGSSTNAQCRYCDALVPSDQMVFVSEFGLLCPACASQAK